MRIDLLQTIDHARLGPGLILFLRGFVSGRYYTFFFFVELLDIVLFFWISNDRLFTRCRENKEISWALVSFTMLVKTRLKCNASSGGDE